MGYRGIHNFIWFRHIVKSVRKTLEKTPSRLFADLGRCFRHQFYSVNCCFHFLEKAEAQARQLVIEVPNSLIQLDAGWREKSEFQRSHLFLISSQSIASSSPRLKAAYRASDSATQLCSIS